jgi:oligoribonuclease
MNRWCTVSHQQSGLTERVRRSQLTLKQAEREVMRFLKHTCGLKKGETPLAGNSMHTDKCFLKKDMPRIEDFLHYRMVDVSSIKEMVRRWMPREFNAPCKRLKHRALEDIKESIEEL